MACRSSRREAAVEGVVEAQVVGRHQRARLAGLLAQRVAQRAVQQVRAGVVAHRAGAPVGIDLGGELLAEADRPCSVPRWTMSPPTGRCVSVDREERRHRCGVAQDAAVADLAAALRVEGRPVEHELGLRGGLGAQLDVRPRLQLLVLGAVADDGHDAPSGASWSRSPGTSCRPTRRAMPPKSAVSSAWRARSCFVPERLRSRCWRGRPRSPRGRRARRTRAASSTVRSMGKP